MNAFLPQLEAVFGWLLAASWQASVLALVVLAIQRILGPRLNPRWRYALWLLVVVRLVLPVEPESALSLFQFAPPPPAALSVSVTQPLFFHEPAPQSMPAASVPVAMPEPGPGATISLYSLLALGWLVGAIALLGLTTVVNWRFARQVAAAPEIEDTEIVRLFAEARAEFGLRRAIRLIESGQVQSPAIMGLFAPTLLLPADVRTKFDARELRFIFLHELAHLKRGDVIVQALIALLQIVHWFNPVLWFAFRRMRIDREPATDALVLSRTGEEEKERYGLMLIKLLEHFNQRHSLATLVGILEDKDQFKRRFSLIARFTRGAYGWSLLGVTILGVLAIAGLTRAHHGFVRDPALPSVIDLKPFYRKVFSVPARKESYAGRQVIDGLPFDVGGQILLYGKEAADRGEDNPDSALGIRIDRKFDELHLVHAVVWREYYGCPVATIRLHYGDGTIAELSIRYDKQVNDWTRLETEDAETIDDPETKVIWRGPGGVLGTSRLFKSTLHNPFPDKKVETMDLVSTHTGCSYILEAATVAQTEPGRAVTAPMPLLPARHFDGALKMHIVDKKSGAPIAGAEIYPAMIIGNISLVADNVVTAGDGSAVVKYPKDGAKDLRVKVTKAGYANCEIHWENGWQMGEIPEEITYRLTRDGDTTVDNTVPDFTVTTSPHPTLLAAVKQGDAVGLQKLMDQGVELPKVDDQGEPLIFSAGSPEVAEILLQHGADPNARNKQKEAVITYFCEGHGRQAAAVVKVLLEHGADPNTRTREIGETPLMVAQDGATVDVLVAHGADVKAKLTDGSGTGIMQMISDQKPECLDALIRHGVPFDPKTDGPTILVHAAWRSNVPMVKDVLDRGVDPNLPGLWAMWHGKPDMMKPMVAAVINGHLEIAGLFLKHGAKVDNQSVDTALGNRQAKIVKFFWENNIRPISELAYAVSQGAPVGDLQKLLDAGMPADAPQDKKFSALEIASQLGNLDAVKLLVSRGAAVNQAKAGLPPTKSAKSSDALMMAASEGQDEVVTYLLAQGATPDATALSQAAENSTPYPDQRSKEHFEKCVQTLIDAGALKNATPVEKGLVLASGIGTRQGPPNATVVKLVLDAGVSPEVPMPYIVGSGEKPNSVIGYYRSYYAKNKDNPDYNWMITQIKPVLDLLEAAEKGGLVPKTTDAVAPQPSSTPPSDYVHIQVLALDLPESDYQANRPVIDDLVHRGYVQTLQHFPHVREITRSTFGAAKFGQAAGTVTGPNAPSLMFRCAATRAEDKINLSGEVTINGTEWIVAPGQTNSLQHTPQANFPFKGTFVPSQLKVISEEGMLEPASAQIKRDQRPYRLFLFFTTWPERQPSEETTVQVTPVALTSGLAYYLAQPVAFDPTPGTHPDLEQALIDIVRDGRTDKVGAGDVNKVRELLGQGASANAEDERGTSVLTWALNFGKDDAAQALIKAGADGRAEDSNGENAAWLAAKIYYCVGALDLLMREGVDVRGVNKQGQTILVAMMHVHPAQAGKMNYLNDRVWTADEFANWEARERRTVELLEDAGVDFNGKDGTTTPLMAAAQGGHAGALRALLAHGADASFKDADGHTALDLAQRFHPEFVPLLKATSPPSGVTGTSQAQGMGSGAGIGGIDPKKLEEDILAAKQDADARRVLVNSVKDLPDDKFVETLAALGRTNPEITALQIEINQKKAALAATLQTYSSNHPRVVEAQAELAAEQARMKDLTEGMRRAMTIDLQMADSRVALLTQELRSLQPLDEGASSAGDGDQIEVSCKVAEVREDVYEVDREKIDAAVKSGDIGYLNTLKGMNLLSAPSVTTRTGQRAVVEITQEFYFPVNFEKGKDGTFVPREFAKKNCGVTATLTPTEVNGKVQVTGALSLTTFEGFTFNGDSDTKVGSPTFRTTESYVFEEIKDGAQIKGVMIPGIQNVPPTQAELTGAAAMANAEAGVPERLMFFLSAKRVEK